MAVATQATQATPCRAGYSLGARGCRAGVAHLSFGLLVPGRRRRFQGRRHDRACLAIREIGKADRVASNGGPERAVEGNERVEGAVLSRSRLAPDGWRQCADDACPEPFNVADIDCESVTDILDGSRIVTGTTHGGEQLIIGRD